MRVLFFLVGWSFFISSARAEAPPVVTFTEGVVELFSDPSQKIHETVPEGAVRAKYEGTHYLATPVKAGAKLTLGAWLRTRPGARARVIFDNGDQMNLGPATLMKIEHPGPKGKGTPEMELRFGTVRSVISKDGPRHRFRVKTSSAVMGVRGTDFIVESHDTTMLTIIRGKVELKVSNDSSSKSSKVVQTGQTAWAEKNVPLQVAETSKPEFERVVEITEGKADTSTVVASSELQDLERRAKEVSKKDILDHAATVEEREKVESLLQKGGDANALNRLALDARVSQAPQHSPSLDRLKKELRRRAKASGQHLENLEKDPYGKYFKDTQSE